MAEQTLLLRGEPVLTVSRFLFRATLLVLHLVLGILLTAAIQLGRGSRSWGRGAKQWWFGLLCRALGMRLTVQGRPMRGAGMLVSNHVSWVDIPVLGAACPVNFLAKAEIRGWPLVGWMASVVGTVFIERGAHGFDAIISALRRDLEAGDKVALFPEGTTTDGHSVMRFLPRLFAAPIEAGCPVQPVAVRYPHESLGVNPLAPFVNNQTLLSHALNLLSAPGLRVEVTFFEALTADESGRRGLSRRSRELILAEVEGAGRPKRPSDQG